MELKEYKSKSKPRVYADKIPVFCAHDAIVEIEQLKENPSNPNQHPAKQIVLLGDIITAAGWRQAITVSTRSGLIVKVAESKKFKSASSAVKQKTLERYFDVAALFGEYTAETLPTRNIRTYCQVEKTWPDRSSSWWIRQCKEPK